MNRKKVYYNQIAKIDARGKFVEASCDSFAIGKIKLSFQSYNERNQAGSKITGKIDAYLDFDKFLYMYNDIISGAFDERMAKTKKIKNEIDQLKNASDQVSQNRYNDAVRQGFDDQYFYNNSSETYYSGGTQRHKDRGGQPEGRTMTLAAGDKLPYILTARSGPGKVNDKTGGIMLAGKADVSILIAASRADFIGFMSLIKAHLDAYLVEFYRRIAEDKEIRVLEYDEFKDGGNVQQYQSQQNNQRSQNNNGGYRNNQNKQNDYQNQRQDNQNYNRDNQYQGGQNHNQEIGRKDDGPSGNDGGYNFNNI